MTLLSERNWRITGSRNSPTRASMLEGIDFPSEEADSASTQDLSIIRARRKRPSGTCEALQSTLVPTSIYWKLNEFGAPPPVATGTRLPMRILLQGPSLPSTPTLARRV